MSEESIKMLKIRAIKAAKDFRYGDEVIKQLKAAKTEIELDRIMKNARHGVRVDDAYASKEWNRKKKEIIDAAEKLPEGIYRCSEVMDTCKYCRRITNDSTAYCDYLCTTGHSRGCPPERCDKYIKDDGVRKKNVFRLAL